MTCPTVIPKWCSSSMVGFRKLCSMPLSTNLSVEALYYWHFFKFPKEKQGKKKCPRVSSNENREKKEWEAFHSWNHICKSHLQATMQHARHQTWSCRASTEKLEKVSVMSGTSSWQKWFGGGWNLYLQKMASLEANKKMAWNGYSRLFDYLLGGFFEARMR